jgi:transposase-like protein
MAKKIRDTAKERRWRETVRRFARSGLSVRAFCRRERLAESAFYFWRRELARRDGEMPKRAGDSRRKLPLCDFLPVRLSDPAGHQASITLEMAVSVPQNPAPQVILFQKTKDNSNVSVPRYTFSFLRRESSS